MLLWSLSYHSPHLSSTPTSSTLRTKPHFATDLENRATALIPTVASQGAARLDGPELLELFSIVGAALRALQLAGDGSKLLILPRVPLNSEGSDGDGFLNSANGDLYAKEDGAWDQRGSLRGPAGTNGRNGTNGTNGLNGTNGKSIYDLWLEAGNTGTTAQFLAAQKGRDGLDGAAGSKISASSNAPTDGTSGDLHYQVLGPERYRIHGNTAGVWAVLYTTPETKDLFGWPATEVAKVTNPANWDSEGGYIGSALSGVSHPAIYPFKSQSAAIPSCVFVTAADNVVLRLPSF